MATKKVEHTKADITALRDRDMRKMYFVKKWTVIHLARYFNVSRPKVYSVLNQDEN